MSGQSRTEIERGIVQDDERVEIAAIKQPEVPISEPVPTEDGREFSADLSAVMTNGDTVVSDTPAPQEEYVEYHVERGGPGQAFVGVPDDEAATRGPVAVDRQPSDEDFQTPTARRDDTTRDDDTRRAEFEEARRAEREAEIESELREVRHNLAVAEASAKVDDMARRLG